MVAGVFCMASMDVMAKILGHSIPVAQIVWLRFVSQALLVGGGLIIARRALFTARISSCICCADWPRLLAATCFFWVLSICRWPMPLH